jgi:hypothetical protein
MPHHDFGRGSSAVGRSGVRGGAVASTVTAAVVPVTRCLGRRFGGNLEVGARAGARAARQLEFKLGPLQGRCGRIMKRQSRNLAEQPEDAVKRPNCQA